MSGKYYLIVFLLFALSTIFTRLFVNYAIKKEIISQPNERSSHVIATPHGGGIVLAVLWLSFSWIFCSYHEIFSFDVFSQVVAINQFMLPIIYAAAIMCIVGFLDDFYNLPVSLRLLVQLLISIFCVLSFGGIEHIDIFGNGFVYLGAWGTVIAIFALVWGINLFNFMDGIDALAAMESIFVLGGGAILYWIYGAHNIAFLLMCLIAVIAGFLVWNAPRAIIFMGSSGSYFLGLVIALFALIGNIFYKIPLGIWFILYGVFWFDATVTLMRRVLTGEKWYMPHRKHACQILHRSGYSHRAVVIRVTLLNAMLASIVLACRYGAFGIKIGLSITVLMLSAIYVFIVAKNRNLS